MTCSLPTTNLDQGAIHLCLLRQQLSLASLQLIQSRHHLNTIELFVTSSDARVPNSVLAPSSKARSP